LESTAEFACCGTQENSPVCITLAIAIQRSESYANLLQFSKLAKRASVLGVGCGSTFCCYSSISAAKIDSKILAAQNGNNLVVPSCGSGGTADALALGASGRKPVKVQILSPAPALCCSFP
jgi:hypothetical protein